MPKVKTYSLKRCPICETTSHMAEVTTAYSGKTFYAVVCDRDSCRLSEPPSIRLCFATERDAINAWNERKGGKR